MRELQIFVPVTSSWPHLNFKYPASSLPFVLFDTSKLKDSISPRNRNSQSLVNRRSSHFVISTPRPFTTRAERTLAAKKPTAELISNTCILPPPSRLHSSRNSAGCFPHAGCMHDICQCLHLTRVYFLLDSIEPHSSYPFASFRRITSPVDSQALSI